MNAMKPNSNNPTSASATMWQRLTAKTMLNAQQPSHPSSNVVDGADTESCPFQESRPLATLRPQSVPTMSVIDVSEPTNANGDDPMRMSARQKKVRFKCKYILLR